MFKNVLWVLIYCPSEVHLNVYGHIMQYKKEVELMIEVARSHIKLKISGGETDNFASAPSNTAIPEKSNA